ncbi:hypothetical protein ABF87_11730 [Nitrosomonas sp. JL21]|nr:hypothetical protein [Nitrosomonas sp. JL21]
MEISEDELTHLNKLIGLIYDGATDSVRWTKEILRALTEYIQAPECILFTPSHNRKMEVIFLSTA